MPPPIDPIRVKCHYGEGIAAVVCKHLVGPSDPELAFVGNSSDPSDLQGWCSRCEEVYLREGDKTPAFLAFNGMTVVCQHCYEGIRDAHPPYGAEPEDGHK